MNRIITASILIILGITLLLKSIGIIPPFSCGDLWVIGHKFWPVLLIFLGIHVLVRDKTAIFVQIAKWLFLLFVGFLLLCQVS